MRWHRARGTSVLTGAQRLNSEMPTSNNDFGDAVLTTNEFGDDTFEQLPEGDLRAVKDVPSEYDYLAPLPPITAEQLGEEHVSHPALPLPTRQIEPPPQRDLRAWKEVSSPLEPQQYLQPLPPITDEQLAGPPPTPGLFERFNKLFEPGPVKPSEMPMDASDRAKLEEAVNRVLLKERVGEVQEPIYTVPTGFRRSIATGTRGITSPAGLATVAAATAAPEVVLPALFAKTVTEVPEVIEKIQKAREEGDRAAYYEAVGDALQTGAILYGTGRYIHQLPRSLEAFRQGIAERAETRFEQAKNITPRPPLQIPEKVQEPLTPEVPSASSQQKAAEVYGDLRPRPVEGEGQMPAAQGGGGIQSQAEPSIAGVREGDQGTTEPTLPLDKREEAEMARVRALPESAYADPKLIAEDIAKAVDTVNVEDIAGYPPVPALVRLIERASRDPAMKPAAEQAMQKIGKAAREQGVPLDDIKNQVAGELKAVYGADAPEMAKYYFGETPAPEAAAFTPEELAEMDKEVAASKALVDREWPPVYKRIQDATGLAKRDLEKLGVYESVDHPSDVRNLARDITANAPGGKMNKLYDQLAAEGHTGRFLWGGTADAPTIGFDPDVPGARPDPVAAKKAWDAVNAVRGVFGHEPLPDFFGAKAPASPPRLPGRPVPEVTKPLTPEEQAAAQPTAVPATKPAPEPPATAGTTTGVAKQFGPQTITVPEGGKAPAMTAEGGAAAKPIPPAVPKRLERPPDIIDEIQGRIGKLSLSAARKIREKFKPTGAARKLFTNTGGNSLDTALDALQREGMFRNIEGEDALLQAIEDATGARKSQRGAKSVGQREIERQEAQRIDFERAALEGRRTRAEPKTTEPVKVQDLLEGDEFTLAGVKVKVKEIVVDADTGDVSHIVLEDGRRFEEQTVGSDRVIYPDKGTLKQKPTVTPKGGELFGETPFNLTGERLRQAKASESPTPKAAQSELFDLQQAVAPKDPVKSANVAQQIYGGAKNAITKLESQLRVIDSDPVTKRHFEPEQRARLKQVLALLAERASQEPPAPPAGAAPETPAETEQSRTSPTADPFERARAGDDSAFDELDAQFREIFPEPDEYFIRGRPNPHQVHTPKQFSDKFNTAFAARDFQTILDTIKATSDVSIWKPFLKDLFAKQATDPIAAKKAEWFRHVFNGTVPPDAIPRASKPPPAPSPAPTATPPTTSAPPPPPPAPPPQRIAVAPITGGGAKSPFKIIEDFENAMKKSIRIRRLKRNQLGVYSPSSTLTAERFAGDLDTTAHELAGHWTDDRYGIGKPWITPRTRSPYDTELAKFWIHGSVTPTSTLRYRRAEGIAEYIRAYVVNPAQAKADAPNFTAYFERTIPADALKAIKDFSDDVRRWAGEDPLIRAGLNMRMDPPSLKERLMRGLRGRGFGFEVSPLDKFRLWFDDPYHYAVKAFHEMRALRGGQLLPKDNFELLSRLLATHDARMSDQFEHGLTPLRPTQTVNPAGKLEVDRLIDPVTKEPMTMEWLVGAFDTTNKAKMLQDMRDASAYMIAQRTIEKGAQLGRDINVSGIGAGILSDKQAAQELLNRVAADPPREARLKEAARRYRLWADQNLDMLVDSGRLTPEKAQKIRDDNQQYVDMHRLSQEFETGFAAQRGGKVGTAIGSAKAIIKRFKGSTLELDNVYSNLLEQTDAIQKEAFRNVAMNTFVDGLRNVRELHGPDLKDFDQFGSKAKSEDRNTITVYKNGKAEYWKFAPDIHESLRGLGELGTHAFIDLLSLPSKFARYMITHGPSFLLRNIVRDTFERSVVSETGSKPTDIAQLYTKEEKSRYEVFGGGQFGNYIKDQHVWNRQLKKAMADLRKDPFNIFVSGGKLWHAWESLSEQSEKLGRIAEFRRAFEHGRTNLGYDDYNAALYAAGEARGLLDFAKAGVVMRSINKLIPFSNARIRGLGKSFSSAYKNPGRFAMNWAMYVLLPTLGLMLWNRKDKKTWEEYLQLPAYRRDFFWNFKFGDYWVMIPKPHLLGVLAGSVERMILRATGDKRAMEGHAGSVKNEVSPLGTLTEATGPLRSYLDLYFNRDSFRGYDIIPAWEKDLRLDLRKGTAHASGAGKGIANAINATGLTVDPRKVDYWLQSYGGLGKLLTDVTKRPLGETSLKATGYATESPGASARDVQWVIDWAKENGKLNDPMLKNIRDLRKLSMDAKDVATRARYSAMMRDEASQLRNVLESLKKK